MLATVISLTAAVVPSIVLLWWFYSNDRFPEPISVVLKTFFLGVLTVAPVLVVALPVMGVMGSIGLSPALIGLTAAFLGAAIPEEFFKFLVLRLYCMKHSEFDEPMDGLVYGAAASLGFATLENILYVAQGGLFLAAVRAFTAVPMHATLGAIMGYYVGQAKFRPDKRRQLLFVAWVVPAVLHGLYDFPLLWILAMTQNREPFQEFTEGEGLLMLGLTLLALVILAIGCVWAFVLARKMRRLQDLRKF